MGTMMKVLITLPNDLKGYLEELKAEGYTISGYIRGLLEDDRKAWREYQEGQKKQPSKGRRRHKRTPVE